MVVELSQLQSHHRIDHVVRVLRQSVNFLLECCCFRFSMMRFVRVEELLQKMKLKSILDPGLRLFLPNVSLGTDNLGVFKIASQFGACLFLDSWATQLSKGLMRVY